MEILSQRENDSNEIRNHWNHLIFTVTNMSKYWKRFENEVLEATTELFQFCDGNGTKITKVRMYFRCLLWSLTWNKFQEIFRISRINSGNSWKISIFGTNICIVKTSYLIRILEIWLKLHVLDMHRKWCLLNFSNQFLAKNF